MRKSLIFTATYNEMDAIPGWLEGVTHTMPDADVLIVDDSSQDGTAAFLQAASKANPRIHVHSRPAKLGLDSAHLFAMDYALQHGYDVLVTMDADGSHQPHQIPNLVAKLETESFCIGTRYRGGSHQAAAIRRLLSMGANGIARVLLPMGVSEYTTSFRAFDRSAVQVALDHNYAFRGYSFFIECMEGIHQAGIPMCETPIDFLDRKGGKSKIPRQQIFLSVGALVSMGVHRLARRVRRG